MTHALPLPDYNNEMYITEYLAKIIEDSIGLKLTHDVTKLYVADATKKDKETVSSLLSNVGEDETKIAVAPFTSTRVKDWPIECYCEFMQELTKRMACRFIIIGGKKDSAKDFYAPDGSIDLRGKTNMTESAEVLRRADYFVGGCSAPLHMASAVGTPSLAFYGATSSVKWAPRNRCLTLQHKMPCSPCDRHYGNVCNGAGNCMKSITVAEAVGEFERLAERYPRSKDVVVTP